MYYALSLVYNNFFLKNSFFTVYPFGVLGTDEVRNLVTSDDNEVECNSTDDESSEEEEVFFTGKLLWVAYLKTLSFILY